MRDLYVLRGAPGSGKSTWIKNSGLTDYTLCADDLRLLVQSPVLNEQGKFVRSQKHDSQVWKMLYTLLEAKMQRGEMVVIDACHSKPSDFSEYKKLADKYRYRGHVVDFTTVPIETALAQNANRQYPVPEEYIRKVYERFKDPVGGFTTLSPSDAVSHVFNLWFLQLDSYKGVWVVGDIHGCYSALKNLPIDPDYYYIFLGDYLDRGLENGLVLEYLMELSKKPNVCLLEGNHERHIRKYAHEEEVKSNEFINNTLPQIAHIDKKELRIFCRRFAQMAYFTFDGKFFQATHGGLPLWVGNRWRPIATSQFIEGVGSYTTAVDALFEQSLTSNMAWCYQIHGHRNKQGYPIQPTPHSFNLDGQVEFGGALRAVCIEPGVITPYTWQNPVYRSESALTPSMIPLVHALRTTRFVKEKQITDRISAFNFTKDAFYKKEWNDITVKARGLHLNVVTGEVVARGYDKFFNIGEQYTFDQLRTKLTFPVRATIKENGFLGMLGWNSETEEPYFCTKSTNQSGYVTWFQEGFYDLGHTTRKSYLNMAQRGYCVLFEVVDKRDPHIIEYPYNQLIKLDYVTRSTEFEVIHEPTTLEFDNWDTFRDFYFWVQDNYPAGATKLWDRIEGYVYRDAKNFMLKQKTPYYDYWKKLRTDVDLIRDGGRVDLGKKSPQAREFLSYVLSLTTIPDIITLRNNFGDLHV